MPSRQNHQRTTCSLFAISALLTLGLLLPSCAHGPDHQATQTPQTAAASPLERFFPLQDQATFIFDQISGPSRHREQMMVRIKRLDQHTALFQTPSSTRRLHITETSVGRLHGRGLLLSAPLRRGSSWTGDNGGQTIIVDDNASVHVPAGQFTGCVRTVERLGSAQQASVTSVYCPNVGLTWMKMEEWVRGQPLTKTMELRSYSSAKASPR